MIDKNIPQSYFDDLIDIGIECLFVALKDFRVGEDNSFLNYWWKIVERRQLTFVQDIFESRILYFDPFYLDNTGHLLMDVPNKSEHLASENILRIIHKNEEHFSQDERNFLEYYILGYKPLEIAEFFSWNKSRLYRTKKRAMDKLNKIIKSN